LEWKAVFVRALAIFFLALSPRARLAFVVICLFLIYCISR